MALALGKIHQGDCVKLMQKIDAGSVDLAFADPPFNIGYAYDSYHDRKPYDDYLDWSKTWISEISRVLKPSGTFWLAIGDDFAAELKVIAQRELGMTCRSWVIWYYTFGVNCTKKFSRSHTHLFHFVKDSKNFTFNATDPAVRVPSARQLVYADKRANSKGRLPDDTWILRPQDAPDSFDPKDDTWYYPRVAGTFKEREGFHGCQMPEQILGRIIRVSSNPGDIVIDPFSGSGTSLVVAKKLNRRWIGTELSSDYRKRATNRLRKATEGDVLDGPENPLVSAPSTPKSSGARRANGRRQRDDSLREVMSESQRNGKAIFNKRNDVAQQIVEAYQRVHSGYSSDYVLANPEFSEAFADVCKNLGVPGSRIDWNRSLLGLRKRGRLPKGTGRRPRHFSPQYGDSFYFASEIALTILNRERGVSLDDILCDVALAKDFDKHARRFAPGFKPFEYRWAALGARKRAYAAMKDAIAKKSQIRDISFPRSQAIDNVRPEKYENQSGIYFFKASGRRELFIGETLDLTSFLTNQLSDIATSPWSEYQTTNVSVIPMSKGLRRAVQASLFRRHKPELNLDDWKNPQVVAL